MIQAEELRVNNIYLNRGIPDAVTRHHYFGAICESWEPIPLTPEWLERCGFEDGKIMPSYKLHMLVRPYQTATQGVFPGEWEVMLIDSIPHRLGHTYRFVHQLQNLYFALTGEELKIEL